MAYYGYRAKDASGNVSVEYNYRIPRILGIVSTGVNSGSIVVPEFAGRSAMFQLLPEGGTQTIPHLAPLVWIDGTTLNWAFNWAAAWRVPARISYGILG
ncbi:hypothetical protein [Achromobacter phage ewik_TL4]|nr:hypothetical protein ART_00021 [Achromobacter phage vB_Ade_ART]WNO48537.1 hypothetical protein [Achromobacter phage hasilly_LB3]WNO48733.1 hypothetical protein [Achromobacter phage nyaak_TL1]WNO48927.1 hypothetical protein [Achromobacter phage ewii_LB8]WNO49198.1 hypothetical protein [Achromobacter phage ewik_TL4]